jgi:hypothetical protein
MLHLAKSWPQAGLGRSAAECLTHESAGILLQTLRDEEAQVIDRSTRPVLAICGSGNGGHALAVAASQHFDGEIDWLVGSEERAGLLRRRISANGLQSTGAISASADRLRTISADPAEVIPEADIVLIVVPAFAHAAVLSRIEPHVGETATIGCLPTRGGFEFEASRLLPRPGTTGSRRLFGLQTLPWTTRIVSAGEVVNFGAVKATVVLAALPAAEGAELAAQLSPILGTRLVPVDGFLNLTLGNPGQFIHPGLMYGHFRLWDGEEYDEATIPLFYADATDEMGDLVGRLSNEAVAVARGIESESGAALDLTAVVPVLEWLKATYSHVTGDVSTVATCFRTGPIQERRTPMLEVAPGRFVPNFEYRYLSEDVPYGLVVTRAIAQIADVATPAIDDVIRWAQSKAKKVYLEGDELSGPDARELPIPQNHEIGTLPDLVEWYGAATTSRGARS